MKQDIGCGRIDCFVRELSSSDKWEVLKELFQVLVDSDLVRDPERALQDLLKRERSLSTGLTLGLAIPHARTDAVDRRCTVLGLSQEGVDFESIDGTPSRIFFLTLTPATGQWPDLECLARLSSAYSDIAWRQSLLQCTSLDEARNVLGRLN